MTLTILEASGEKITLDILQSQSLLRFMDGEKDPRISACLNCNSAVLAAEPFSDLLDDLSTSGLIDTDVVRELIDLVDEAEEVHIYLWEENECIHNLWRDPLAAEWSEVTGEKRLHT